MGCCLDLGTDKPRKRPDGNADCRQRRKQGPDSIGSGRKRELETLHPHERQCIQHCGQYRGPPQDWTREPNRYLIRNTSLHEKLLRKV